MHYCLWLLGDQALSEIDFKTLQSKIEAIGISWHQENGLAFSPFRLGLKITSDLAFSELKSSIRNCLVDYSLDFVLKPWGQHVLKPKLIIMDMDSTLVQAETIDQIANHAGVMDKVSAITESAMRGELDFTESLKARVAMLKGLNKSQLEPVHKALPLTEGAAELVTQAQQHNCQTALVSGGFTYFAEPLANRIGVDSVRANELGFKDNCLSGVVVGEIVDAEFKRRRLNELMKELGITREQTIAIGDGANDLPMLGAAGTGIAFHGKPKVQEQANAMINIYGLNAVSWLLGW